MSFEIQKCHYDDVPTDDERVEQIHHPDESSYSHCNSDCDQLADEHAAKASKLNGEMRDEGVYFRRSNVERRQGGE